LVGSASVVPFGRSRRRRGCGSGCGAGRVRVAAVVGAAVVMFVVGAATVA
jgi:hypothetical protein